ncbi:cyclohexa-1,5-dienecarbonyl-CoA hydratase [Rhodoblastus sphagnicola]|uniref:Cyclohexa-1,5-dienecarbonyl-CoA hydratase n=1 Tax=Rhodoblastus sphagnicola TaxID=333368 RepID=A0A2S6MX47_9HYPH|nr:cyclohexa-1,5-dienecarbonyl-CoA hydratase [Rhodoblastus sphagnicola]MBB4199273.1 cyclohexa-1,5-dienecarbonyl-CoA hydratase [Rhodoblastus sphagnicola]PPQ26942.1 cyclohexa-1,5-dienecarbonyl-CoA hydratase [Rhodoblastus sphagnicola]
MSGSLSVWIERDGKLLRLRLDRPKANVLDAEMIAALRAAFATHCANASLRGVLIDASGPHFSFGASVEEHLPEKCAAMLGGFHALILDVLKSPIPVLVALRGQCLGGGLELASAAHLLFAAPDTRLGQPEIALGVFAPAASCLLTERITRAAAEDLLLSGRSITGIEAYDMGLINGLSDNPEAAALDYFDAHLARKSANALRFATRAARLDFSARVATKLAAVEELYLNELMQTHDAVEGLTAFIEKRETRWKDQ